MNQPYIPKESTGNLFKNDKGDNQSRPDYRGDAMINGELLKVAAWIKEGPKGKYMSLVYSPAEQRQAPAPKPQPKPAKAQGFDDMDSDVPF